MLTIATALAYRWRGQDADTQPLWPSRLMAPWLPREPLCGLLVALPVLVAALASDIDLPGLPPIRLGWALSFGLFVLVAGLSTWGVNRGHNPGADTARERLLLALTGLAWTGFPAVALALLGNWLGAAALALAGLAKPLAYLLPRGTGEAKFLKRELAFGAVVGTACDFAWLVEVLR